MIEVKSIDEMITVRLKPKYDSHNMVTLRMIKYFELKRQRLNFNWIFID